MRSSEYIFTSKSQRPESLLSVQQLHLFVTSKVAVSNAHQLQEVPVISAIRTPQRTGPVVAISISLRCTKNDPLKKGTEVRLGHNLPIRLLTDFLAVHPTLSVPTSGVFVHPDGSRLTSNQLTDGLQNILREAGIPEVQRYTTHSLRQGGTQSLHDARVPLDDIQVAGRWVSRKTPHFYFKPSLPTSVSISRRMLGGSVTLSPSPSPPSSLAE